MAKDFLTTAAQVLMAPHKIKAQRDVAQTRAKSAMDVAQMKEGGLWGRAKMVDQTKRDIASAQWEQHAQKMMFDAQYRENQLEWDKQKFGMQFAQGERQFFFNAAKFEEDMRHNRVTEDEAAAYHDMMNKYHEGQLAIRGGELQMEGAKFKYGMAKDERDYQFDVEGREQGNLKWQAEQELRTNKEAREQQRFPVEMADLQARGYLHGRQAAGYETEQQAKLENYQSQINSRLDASQRGWAQVKIDNARLGLLKQSKDSQQLQSNLRYNLNALLRIDLARARDAKSTQNMLRNILNDTRDMVNYFHGNDIKMLLAKQKDAQGKKLIPGSPAYQEAYMGAVMQYTRRYLESTGIDPAEIMKMSPYNQINPMDYQMRLQPDEGQ